MQAPQVEDLCRGRYVTVQPALAETTQSNVVPFTSSPTDRAFLWASRLPPGTSHLAWRVFVTIAANYAHPDGTGAFASIKTMALKAGLNERTLKRGIHELTKAGVLLEDGWSVHASNIRTKRRRINVAFLFSGKEPNQSDKKEDIQVSGNQVERDNRCPLPSGQQVSLTLGTTGVPQTVEERGRKNGSRVSPSDLFLTADETHGEKSPKATRQPTAKPKTDRDAAFEAFWKAYPRKVGKPDAKTKFSTACKRFPLDEIMEGLARYKFRDDPQYIPHPATWLHQERWRDVQQDLTDDPYGLVAYMAKQASPGQLSIASYETDAIRPILIATGWDATWRGDLAPLNAWLRDGYLPDSVALVIASAVAEFGGRASLMSFDKRVRYRAERFVCQVAAE